MRVLKILANNQSEKSYENIQIYILVSIDI